MIENRYKNRIITKFKTSEIQTIVPSIASVDSFFFRIPVVINKNNFLSLNNKFKIQVVCQDKNTFKKTFLNKFYNNTLDYKSYSKSNESELLNKFLHKNIFLEYNKNSNNENNLIFTSEFNSSILQEAESKENFFSFNRYFINFTSNFSKKIFNKNIKNIRVILLDDKNNVIDETGVLDCNFRLIRQQQKLVDDKVFYQNYFLNSFSNNLKIISSKDCNIINIVSSSIIDTEMFESFNISLTYTSGKKPISCYSNNINFNKGMFSLTEDVSSFCFLVAEDFYLGLETFDFKITIDLNIKTNKQNNNLPKKQKIVTLFKEISYTKEKVFPRNCANFFKNKIFSNIMKKLKFKQNVSTIGNNKIFNSIKISDNISDTILENILIKEIKLNNVILDNKIFEFKEFSVENIINFKGKSILEVFKSNLFEFYCRTLNREIVFDIEIEYLGKRQKFTSDKIINKFGYESTIKKFNRLSKSNITVSGVEINTFLSSNKKTIFNFNNIVLSNLSSYNDIAYSLGYTLESQGDIKKFLSNCIVKIENTTKITEIDLINHNTNYFFFNELFNMQEFQSGSVSINKNYINNYINTDEYFSIVNKKRNEINKNIIDFFISSNTVNSFRKISKENSLNIENNISIKLLPIPEIISTYRGYDLDQLENPIDSDVYSDIENLSTIKSRITRELVVYLYTGNPNLNWSKFNKYKKVLMDSTKSDSVNNYSEFFDDIVFLGMEEQDYFKNSYRYDKNEILNLQNIDSLYLNSSIQASSIEQDFSKKYYNFSFSNKEFFIENLPFSILFQNNNYSSIDNEYKPEEIKIVKSASDNQIKINITNLKNIYTINQIKEARYYVRCSLHFLMEKENESLESISTTNTDFLKTILSGSECLTYNSNYVDKKPASFKNLKNLIDASKIECKIESDKIYLIINDETNSLDISNLNYNQFNSFFDFCKTNNTNYLLRPILRLSISSKIPETDDFIFGVFNHNIPYINLNDKKISLINLSKINSLIVT